MTGFEAGFALKYMYTSIYRNVLSLSSNAHKAISINNKQKQQQVKKVIEINYRISGEKKPAPLY